MNTLWIVLIAAVVIYLAYNFYAKQVDRDIIKADRKKATPAKAATLPAISGSPDQAFVQPLKSHAQAKFGLSTRARSITRAASTG